MRAECTPSGYQLLDRARSAHRQGGGTALLCRDSFTLKYNASGEVSSFEFSDWTISSSEISLRIILIYRPPYSRNHPISISTFLDQFSSLLEPILLCKEPLIITGDFNIHVDIPSESLQFSELLRSLSLIQHVNQPTHEKGHILDLIISRSADIILSDPSPVHLFSDQISISCSLSLSKPSLSSQFPIVPNPSTSQSFLLISLPQIYVLAHLIILRNLLYHITAPYPISMISMLLRDPKP